MAVAPDAGATLAAPLLGSGADRAKRTILRNRHLVAAGSLLFLLPEIVFALTLQPVPAAAVLAGALGASAFNRASPPKGILAERVSGLRLAGCLALALGLLLLGGEAHVFFANWDWLWRDAVLADVSRGPFPPTYAVGAEHFVLRAPLGMYMLPGLVARLAGLAAGHAALLGQNAVLLALVLYLLATLAGRRFLLVVAVFVSFSGLDVLGQGLASLWQGHGAFVLPSHIESWMPGLQYSSVVTQLFWVPNHALPSFWLALLVLFCVRGEATLAQLGLAMAVALFWSPFAVIGTLPFAVMLLVTSWRETLRSPRFWAATALSLCFLPVALYLRVDAGQVPHAFVLFRPFMIVVILLFLAVEIPHVWLVLAQWSALDPALARVTAVAVAVLVALPTMRFGLANDLAMRASIPALTILALAFAEALAASARARRVSLVLGGSTIVLVGAVTPAQELVRALRVPAFAESACNLVTVWKKLDPAQPRLENYLAREGDLPRWLLRADPAAALGDDPSRRCWPDLSHTSMERWSDTPVEGILRAGNGPRL